MSLCVCRWRLWASSEEAASPFRWTGWRRLASILRGYFTQWGAHRHDMILWFNIVVFSSKKNIILSVLFAFWYQFQLVRCIYLYINVHNSCPKNYIRTLIFSSQCQIMMKASKWRWRQQQTVVCLMKVWLRYRSGFIIFPRFFVVLFFYFSRSSELFLNLSSVFFFCTDSPGGWRIIVDQSEDRSVSSQSGLVHD